MSDVRRKNGRIEEWRGSFSWYKDGELHREGGPAIEWEDGKHKEWYLHGELHREDGPAVEQLVGNLQWWVHGVQYTEEEFSNYIEKKKLNESLRADLDVKANNNKKTKI